MKQTLRLSIVIFLGALAACEEVKTTSTASTAPAAAPAAAPGAAPAAPAAPVLTADGYPILGPLAARKAQEPAKLEMGRRLFYDARVSGDGAISCATCHDPAKGFGDGMPLSKAYPGTDHFRNAPTLINAVYKSDFKDVGWSWDGRMGSDMNDVIRDMITETTMMNLDMRILHERMKQDPEYVRLCKEAFKDEKDCTSPYARNALIAYLETLVSKDAPFDAGKMSDAAQRGRAVFEGKGKCISCHNGVYLSDGKPHNTGVPENMEVFKNPVRHLTYQSLIDNHGVPKPHIWRRDVGYYTVSKNLADVGKFITPTLRELKYTAPYMHNGTMATLADVVEFYNQGGGKDDPLAAELKPLGLSGDEKSDLTAFLESLSSAAPVTDTPVVSSQKYQPIKDWLNVKN